VIGELLEPELWIGIDQSYSGFGLIVLDKEKEIDRQLWKFPVLDSDGARLHGIREALSSYLRQLRTEYPGWRVYLSIEGYAHGSRFNREKLGELGGLVKLVWYESFYSTPLVVPPTVLKKYVTGKGTAKKADMVKSVNERWSAGIKNDNLADAYALAHYSRSMLYSS
jgi:Holliday junction resolvasome RuvABC endonuclease subunit